jgi:hypothetical protein
MGGKPWREICQRTAVETVVKHCLEGVENPEALWWRTTARPYPQSAASTQPSIRQSKVFQSAEEHPEQLGWCNPHRRGSTTYRHGPRRRQPRFRFQRSPTTTRSDHSPVRRTVHRNLAASEAEQSNCKVFCCVLCTSAVEVDAERRLFPAISCCLLRRPDSYGHRAKCWNACGTRPDRAAAEN